MKVAQQPINQDVNDQSFAIETPSNCQLFVKHKIISTTLFQFIIIFTTVFVLIGDSIRMLVIDSRYWNIVDTAFFIGFVASAFIFSGEMLAQCYATPDYFPWKNKTGNPEDNVKPMWHRLKEMLLPKGSFYFWFDLIATISLSFELMSFMERQWDGLAPVKTTIYHSGYIDITLSNMPGQFNKFTPHHTQQFGMAGADSLYLVLRISRMIRLFRIVKLYKSYQRYVRAMAGGRNHKFNEVPERKPILQRWTEECKSLTSLTSSTPSADEEESMKCDVAPVDACTEARDGLQIGQTMSETTLKRTTLGVLIILMVLPALEIPVFNTSRAVSSYFSHLFFSRACLCNHELLSNETTSSFTTELCAHIEEGLDMSIRKLSGSENNFGGNLLKLKNIATYQNQSSSCNQSLIPCVDKYTTYVGKDSDPSKPMRHLSRKYQYRKHALSVIVFKGYSANLDATFKTISVWDQSSLNAEKACSDIMLTGFIVIVLSVAIIVFSIDTQSIVLSPFDRLMRAMDEITQHPLSVSSRICKLCDYGNSYEIYSLVAYVQKRRQLLCSCIGEAGISIMNSNLQHSNFDIGGKSIDIHAAYPLFRGASDVVAIYAFCDIRGFTDATECLQEDVMTFVNRLGFILHGIAVECGGSPGENVGDAFSCSWRVPEKYCIKDNNGEFTGEIMYCDATMQLFDKALYAQLRFNVLIRQLNTYITTFGKNTSDQMKGRFGGNYRVEVGTGLHCGKGFGGGIGTMRKIDFALVGVHVMIAEKCESLTKKYGLSLILTNIFKDHLSPHAQSLCRYVDKERFDSFDSDDPLQPSHLWTYDMLQAFQVDEKVLNQTSFHGRSTGREQRGVILIEKSSTNNAKSNARTRNEAAGKSNAKITVLLQLNCDEQIPSFDNIPIIGYTLHDDDVIESGETHITQENFVKYVWKYDDEVRNLRECIDTNLMRKWLDCVEKMQAKDAQDKEVARNKHKLPKLQTGRASQEEEITWVTCLESLHTFQASHVSWNQCNDGPTKYLIEKINKQIAHEDNLTGLMEMK